MKQILNYIKLNWIELIKSNWIKNDLKINQNKKELELHDYHSISMPHFK